MRRAAQAAAAVLATVALTTAASAGQVTVGSGASFDLGTGSMDLGCGDLTVGGAFWAGTLGFTARDVTIQPSGVVNGESSTMEVSGDWANAGTFNPGTSIVAFVDDCGILAFGDGFGASSATISGDTTFASLDMTTTIGKLYSFTSGSTQTMTSSLTLLGAVGNLLTIRSTVPGSAAFLDLQGSHSADFVDVDDSDASAGNPILLGSNSVTGSNTPGWGLAVMLPALGIFGLTALVLTLLATTVRTLAARKHEQALNRRRIPVA